MPGQPPPARTHERQRRAQRAQAQEQRREDVLLAARAPHDVAVAHVAEADARVLRRPPPRRHVHVQALLDVLAPLVQRRRHAAAHLGVVGQGQVGDDVRVLHALGRVCGEGVGSGFARGGRGGAGVVAVAVADAVELGKQHAHGLEPGVHALAVEGHHGVGGVAEDHDAVAEVVRRAFDVDQWEVRVALELRDQVRRCDVRGDAREIRVEGGHDGFITSALELGEQRHGPEERAHERLVQVGQGDEHEAAGGPDVQMVGRDGEVARRGRRRHRELAPQAVDVLLRVVHARELHHVVPHGRVRAVGADAEVERHLDFAGSRTSSSSSNSSVGGGGACAPVHDLKPRLLAPKVRAGQFVLVEEAHVGQRVEVVEQDFIQLAAVDGALEAAVHVVRLGLLR